MNLAPGRPGSPAHGGRAVLLGRGPSQIARARRLARQALTAAGITDHVCLDSTLLIVSELVTNALVHTRGRPLLVIETGQESVRIQVRDDDPRLPAPYHPAPGSPHGRGLALVAALAHHHGTHHLPPGHGHGHGHGHGKVVWASLPTRPDGQ
ncbi:ATP-binding protein [Streptomyces sp. NPDC051921]|uniref:ATP-binding protein n=1 Tax=Streptomyces sp. NPDC051921 TaxID=3155806 RepID=UPI0034394AED